MAGKESVPVVAQRNDPNPLEPYRKSRSTEIAGRRPGFTYEWFRRDQLAVKLSPHQIPDELTGKYTGFLMVDGWEAVPVDKIEIPGPGMPSAGKPVDTVVTNGELVLCCTPDENYAKYAVIERKLDQLVDKRLTAGESHDFGDASFKTRTMGDRGQKISINKLLDGVQ